METKTLNLNEDWQGAALHVLRTGGVVGVPTETVYGLAGDATNARAVAAIYAAKGRPSHNPLIAHIADLGMGERYAQFSDEARRLADAFWPGPLTLVLPLIAGTNLAARVTAEGDSLAVRCPQGPLGALAALLGRPLAAPSANRSGHVSATTAAHVLDDLKGHIPLVVDGGATRMGLESTIVDMRQAPVLLRPGAIAAEAVQSVLAAPSLPYGTTTHAPVAPGQLASHYAPDAQVRLNVLPDDVQQGEIYLGFGSHTIEGQPNLSPKGALEEAAVQLYATLRAADAQNPTGIAIAPIPTHGLGTAIQDRLARASAPHER